LGGGGGDGGGNDGGSGGGGGGGEVTFVVFDADGGTAVTFDVGGAGLVGGGAGETRFHMFGGPSVDDVSSERVYNASHAVAR